MNNQLESATNGICPPRQALELIGDRWTMIVIKALASGNQRYGALQRGIGGISQKMLTQTLRSLERDGLASRTAYLEMPPRVEYGLTPLGETLIEVLMTIGRWAEEHMAAVERARAAHNGAIPAGVAASISRSGL